MQKINNTKKAIKPTQEWFARVNNHVSMPIAVFLARYTKVTPTQVTITSIIVGILSGFLLAISGYIGQLWPVFTEYQVRIAGGVLAYVFGTLDGVDGKLARLKDNTTHLGKWWDGVAGQLSITLMFFGLAIGLKSYFALIIAFIASASFMIAYLQIALYKIDFGSVMEKEKVDLIKNRRSWTYIYGMSLLFPMMPIASIINYPMIPLYFYSFFGILFYLAVVYFQYNALKKIKKQRILNPWKKGS